MPNVCGYDSGSVLIASLILSKMVLYEIPYCLESNSSCFLKKEVWSILVAVCEIK